MSSDTPEAPPAPRGRAPTRRPGPADGPRAKNREARRAELEEAALGLFLERGLDSVALEDIATAAGMSKSNLYRYFPTREAVVEALLAPLAEGFEAAFAQAREGTCAASARHEMTAVYLGLAATLFQAIARHERRMRLFLQEGRGPEVGARAPLRALERSILQRAVALTEAAQERGLLRRIPPEVSAWVVVGAVERLLLAWLRDRAFASPADVIEPLVRLVMEGLGQG